MRFVHIADVHLGAKPDAGPLYSKMRPRELWESFEQVLRVCEEEKTDLLLIAGDLFHRQPLVRELKEAGYLFSELTHTKVVLIAEITIISGRIPTTGRFRGAIMYIHCSDERCSALIFRNFRRQCTD